MNKNGMHPLVRRIQLRRQRLRTERQREIWIQNARKRLEDAAFEFTAAVESIPGAASSCAPRKRAKS